TVGELTGAQIPENTDGISFLPTLLGEDQKKHDYLYWEFHEMDGRKALRKDNWKLVHYKVNKPEETTTELYNLEADLGEENNVATAHPDVVQELEVLMESARTPSEIFPFQK
ncbi:MAG: sulfatase/phosphatase domain-containing protein, partial [Draconibacterium sp.]